MTPIMIDGDNRNIQFNRNLLRIYPSFESNYETIKRNTTEIIKDFIECDKNDIPSTAVNIEDVIEVIYNSTINDQATNIIEITNNSNKGQQLVNKINGLIKKLTQLNYNKSYTISNNYNLSFCFLL